MHFGGCCPLHSGVAVPCPTLFGAAAQVVERIMVLILPCAEACETMSTAQAEQAGPVFSNTGPNLAGSKRSCDATAASEEGQ